MHVIRQCWICHEYVSWDKIIHFKDALTAVCIQIYVFIQDSRCLAWCNEHLLKGIADAIPFQNKLLNRLISSVCECVWVKGGGGTLHWVRMLYETWFSARKTPHLSLSHDFHEMLMWFTLGSYTASRQSDHNEFTQFLKWFVFSRRKYYPPESRVMHFKPHHESEESSQ